MTPGELARKLFPTPEESQTQEVKDEVAILLDAAYALRGISPEERAERRRTVRQATALAIRETKGL